MTEQEETLCKALSYAKIDCLPAEDKSGNGDWKKAIALVTKATNRQSYVIVRKEDGAIDVIKDFGALSTIVHIDRYFPFFGLPAPTYRKPGRPAAQKSEPSLGL